MLLAAAFTNLSFQAVRNINLFGMVAGAVLAWNVGEWAAALAADGRWLGPVASRRGRPTR